ncbi:ribonuclease J [Candidatus Mycoplasma haematominutum]|uniref:Metallo-beta-lactamase domain-containing protein n=1 Tax=Candidatus Mycoplasma haematominutum 'Birmingham 1' TaxID=1116213 RepID=G8C373_9MOLU|nr:ribonuclease J [Candidatus Mycoplasma haematominutum]CCE66771.1 conserved hypothetical protein (metallo-beta-lactamase superfamily protein) [Candidatus Mycoplasma haematominutum 'Birmingham 1']
MIVHTIEQHLFEARKTRKTVPTHVYSLGGIEEIGKNCYCIETPDELIIMDFGIKFGNKLTQPGITGEVPNLEYLTANKEKISALFISHGHEDHIGGVPHLLARLEVPAIYAPALALELIKKKLEENKVELNSKLEVYDADSLIVTRNFAVEFFEVNHSIPDSYGLFVSTPNGAVVFSGDFRFDLKNKINSKAFQKLINIGGRQVDLLLCESTAAATPGFNESEATIIQELKNIISSSRGRIIITFFASNLGRIEEIVKLAHSKGRKIVVFGRSIDSSLKCSQTVGLLNANELKEVFISPQEMENYDDSEILVICTGSQGEEASALSLISRNAHTTIQLKPTDDIIFSSNAIPGNKQAVNELVNRLYKSGCNIYLNSPECRIHASGHATKLEQQLFISLISPRFLAPIHGERKMLHDLKRNVAELNIVPNQNIFILKNGAKLSLLNGNVTKTTPEEDIFLSSPCYILENKLTEGGKEILAERTQMAQNGLVALSLTLDPKERVILDLSPISTIGSLPFSLSGEILRELNRLIVQKLESILENPKLQLNSAKLQQEITKLISDYFASKQTSKIPNSILIIEEVSVADFWKDAISANEKAENLEKN